MTSQGSRATDPVIPVIITAAGLLLNSLNSDRRRRRRRRRVARLSRPRRVIHARGHRAARQYASSLLVEGADSAFYELFRMTKETFHELVNWLLRNTSLQSSRYQTIEHKVMVFLYMVGGGQSQRFTAHFFGITQSSVSRTFRIVLTAMVKLHTAYVKQPGDSFISAKVALDRKYSAFAGCIRAIDGTHVIAHIPVAQQSKFWNRKSDISQNILAAVKMDGTFSYVLAGAEGRIHDSTLAKIAMTKSFRIPEGRFYLSDAGFGLQEGLLVPYTNIRYYIED